MPRAKQETWQEAYDRHQIERATEKRERWTGQLFRFLEVLQVLQVKAESIPVIEIAEHLGRTSYYDRDKIAITCRKLATMGMTVREQRKYENVVRWSLSEHGQDFLDRLADKDGTGA